MRQFCLALLGCLLLAAAPVQSADDGSAVLVVTADGVAEAVVEFPTDVTIDDAEGRRDLETDAWDVSSLIFETDADFSAVALVQETFDPDVGPLELIATRTTARGVVDEGLILNGRDRREVDAWKLDAGRYRVFVVSSASSTFHLALNGLPHRLDVVATPTDRAGLLDAESRNPAPTTRHWTTLRRFDQEVTALVHTWHHSGDDTTLVRASTDCRITESSDVTLTWLPGCPTGQSPQGGGGPDVTVLSAGGRWSTSFFYAHPSFNPTVGKSSSVTHDPATAPIRAGMLGLWWSKEA